MVLVVALSGVFRGVIARSFGDPLPNQGDFEFVKGIFLFGHFRIAFGIRGDFFDEVAFVRLSGNDCDSILTARKEAVEISHDIVAIVLGGLVAAETVRLKDGANVMVVADRPIAFLGRENGWKEGGKAEKGGNESVKHGIGSGWKILNGLSKGKPLTGVNLTEPET